MYGMYFNITVWNENKILLRLILMSPGMFCATISSGSGD